ncbi:hypothetical protein C1645_828484 [Glomus cerebriforme]|uniref:Uncharacterized protein n=1 Tax=Glomus cerebriforme TaxID=658196 RepID=A0A397SSG1_9GLOM|nr:hypothetical protein C1645_828484 [Glomus cerebriforme]
MIDNKTVRCKCGVEVRLDRPFRTINFERHIKSSNCILGTNNQPSLYVFFDQNQDMEDEEEHEDELHKPLPCIGLFGGLYTEYATSTPAFFDHFEGNGNLRNLWTCIITNNNDSTMWASLAQMGMNGAFNGKKTFIELVSLMVQIKKKEDAGTSMKGFDILNILHISLAYYLKVVMNMKFFAKH